MAGMTKHSALPVLELLRMRLMWSFTLSKVFLDPAWYFYIFWFPEYEAVP